jgi:hypothetical protein
MRAGSSTDMRECSRNHSPGDRRGTRTRRWGRNTGARRRDRAAGVGAEPPRLLRSGLGALFGAPRRPGNGPPGPSPSRRQRRQDH